MIKYIARAMKRQVANRIAYIILAVAIALIPALMGGYSANAATLPSENIAQSLLLGGGSTAGGCFSQSVYLHEDEDYNDIFTDESKHYHYSKAWKPSGSDASLLQFADKWISAQDNDDMDWAIVQVGYGRVRFIIFNKDAEFTVNNTGIHITENRIISQLDLWFNENVGCRLQIEYPIIDVYAATNNPLIAWNTGGDPNVMDKVFVLRSPNISYEETYTGTDIPTVPPGAGGKQTIRPTISATITDKTVIFKLDELPFKPCRVNYMISYSEKNNNDYGESVLETLKNGWQQIFSGDITLEEWRSGGDDYDAEVIDFKYKINPDEEVFVNAPDTGSIMVFIGVETDWGGAPHKLCGDNGNPDEFEYEVEYRLQFINIDGSNYVIDGTMCNPDSNICDTTTAKSDLMDCFTNSFPFINLTECKNAVAVIGERLSFNKLNFGNSWIYSPQCEKLGVLGVWINADNQVVCPYFPSYVRNTIDPFVTFMLGLLVVTFVARQTGKAF